MNDFKNDNYLKINNRPVFYIHHPWVIPNEKLVKLKVLLNNVCINNGFSGINLKLNSMNENDNIIKTNKSSYYDFHPNYKKTKSFEIGNDNKIAINYDNYLKNDVNCISNVQTIFFDFDNKARLCCPDKLDKSTICINNNENNYIKYIDKINHHFINNCTKESMILINAWNEWGEKMHIEPSEQKGTYYLDLIKKKFTV